MAAGEATVGEMLFPEQSAVVASPGSHGKGETMSHWGTVSGVLLILVGAVLVGLGQRLSDDVATLSTAVRKHIAIVRHRLVMPRRPPHAAGQLSPAHSPSPRGASHVEHVIRQLSQGSITDAEKQQLATALMPETMGALQLSVDAPTANLSDSVATAAEALTIAVVASSAAKRLGDREVLAIRMLGILVLAVGGMVTLLTVLRP
jgi:hypothetical protein